MRLRPDYSIIASLPMIISGVVTFKAETTRAGLILPRLSIYRYSTRRRLFNSDHTQEEAVSNATRGNLRSKLRRNRLAANLLAIYAVSILNILSIAGANMKTTIEKVEYKGWKNNLKLSNSEAELIITLDVGPRVIRYGYVGGANVFKEFDPTREFKKRWMSLSINRARASKSFIACAIRICGMWSLRPGL
jgi:hypothetical protein